MYVKDKFLLPGCEDKLKHRIPNKYYGKGDTYLIQYSKNVVTYDNMIINKLYREVDSDSVEYAEELADGTVIVDNITEYWNNDTSEVFFLMVSLYTLQD